MKNTTEEKREVCQACGESRTSGDAIAYVGAKYDGKVEILCTECAYDLIECPKCGYWVEFVAEGSKCPDCGLTEIK